VSIAQRRHDPRGLLLKGYDHHQPTTRAYTSLVEALTSLEWVGLAVVRRRHGDEYRVEVRGQFSVALAGIEDVLVPGVSEQNDANLVLPMLRSSGLVLPLLDWRCGGSRWRAG
jgi:hypothetical protein